MTRCAFLSRVSVLSLVPLLALSACAMGGGEVVGGDAIEQDVSSTTYIDIMDFRTTDQGQWYDTIRKLDDEFAGVCGDTFCEGDWSNLTPLTFGCSVSTKLGTVHDCAWTFAASQVAVDPVTAAIVTNAATFQCHITAKTSSTKLITLLSSSADAIHEPLFGSPSLSDQLGDCFAHPIGATPITVATGTTYVAATDYYGTAVGQKKWHDAQAALVAGFDNVCGDTFCGSDFSDLQSLAFECAVTKSNGNVKSCAWVFGGSYHVVPSKGGALQETSSTFRCPFTVKGTLPQLITALTAPGAPDAIHRPLPGMTASAYDALGGCLP